MLTYNILLFLKCFQFKVSLFSARLSSFLTVVKGKPPAMNYEEILEKGIDFMIPGCLIEQR